jgi:hypothetical protein
LSVRGRRLIGDGEDVRLHVVRWGAGGRWHRVVDVEMGLPSFSLWMDSRSDRSRYEVEMWSQASIHRVEDISGRWDM